MTFYLFEGDVRNDEYAADSVIGVVNRIAELYRPDSVEHQFAGDVIIYDDERWQSLLDDFRYDEEDPDGLEQFLESSGAPANIPGDKLVMYVSAHSLEEPSVRGSVEVHALISKDPKAEEVEQVFRLVLPDFDYRIREDAH